MLNCIQTQSDVKQRNYSEKDAVSVNRPLTLASEVEDVSCLR